MRPAEPIDNTACSVFRWNCVPRQERKEKALPRDAEVESIVRSESPTDHAPTRVEHDAEIESRGIESGRHSPDSCVIKAHNLDEYRVEACGDIMTQEVLRRSTGRCRGRKVAMTIGIREQSIIIERPDIWDTIG